MQILKADVVLLRATGEPKEGRMAFRLNPVVFLTGDEVFNFSTEDVQTVRKASGIQSMWIDASQLTIGAGQSVVIDTGMERFVVTDVGQGYCIVTCNLPMALRVSASHGVTGTLNLILFNYMIYDSGNTATSAASTANASVASSGAAVVNTTGVNPQPNPTGGKGSWSTIALNE